MTALALPKAGEDALSHKEQQSRRDTISKFAKKHRAIQSHKTAEKSSPQQSTPQLSTPQPSNSDKNAPIVEDANLPQTPPKALPKEKADAVDGKHAQPARDKISKFAQKRRTLQDNTPPKHPNSHQNTKGKKTIHAHDDDPMGDDGTLPKALPKALSMILAMAWHDVYLKEAFIENPVEIARLLGVDLPEGVILKAEDVRGKCCVTIMEFNAEMGIHRRGMSLKLDLVAEV